jgi:hypothetical protein
MMFLYMVLVVFVFFGGKDTFFLPKFRLKITFFRPKFGWIVTFFGGNWGCAPYLLQPGALPPRPYYFPLFRVKSSVQQLTG